MSEIDQIFGQLRQQGRKALIPFLTAGDPDLETTARLVRRFAGIGCPLCELGFPYSDSIADGPVIQASYTRALAAGATVEGIFQCAAQLAELKPLGLIAMVSYSLVCRRGVRPFIERAASAGFAGAIIPDLPLEESGEAARVARQCGMALIPLITPLTPPQRARQIAAAATGFIYYVSVAGITGERVGFADQVAENVRRLRQVTDLPICVGFGVSRPEHVGQLSAAADGVIVGSAIVRRIAAGAENAGQRMIDDVVGFVQSLQGGLDPRPHGPA